MRERERERERENHQKLVRTGKSTDLTDHISSRGDPLMGHLAFINEFNSL